MDNPVKKLRESLNLTRRAFCVLYFVPISTLSNCENGNIYRIPRGVFDSFRRAGIPENSLAAINDQYREWQNEEAQKELICSKCWFNKPWKNK